MNILLYVFFGLLGVVCSICVINSKNPIYSVLCLILVFVNAMGMVLVLGLEFLGLVILLVYVGAVAVLFLFIVMMLNVKVIELSDERLRFLPLGFSIVMLFLFEVFILYNYGFEYHNISNLSYVNWVDISDNNNTLEVLGSVLYTYYVYYFIIACLILLLAMVGAICITYLGEVKGKRQKVYKQVLRDYKKSVRLAQYK